MAIEFIKNIINTGYNLTKINDNFDKIQTALLDGLSRSGNSPNQMEADLDMNNYDIINLHTLQVDDITIDGTDATGILQRAEDAVVLAEAAEAAATDFAELAQAWAEAVDEPGGPGTKSSKTWAQLAETYAGLTINNRFEKSFAGNGVATVFVLDVDPGSGNNVDINVDGVWQLRSSYSVSGTTITFTEAPPGNGVIENINVVYGGRIDVNSPGAGTVDSGTIDNTDLPAIRTVLDVYSKSEVNGLVSGANGIRGHLWGLIGSNNVTDANNDMDFSSGEAASVGTGPIIMTLTSSITKRSDAAWAVGTGNGSMDTGNKPTNGWLHWYIIQRPDTNVVDVCSSVSASAPTFGVNIPAAYTKYRRIRSTKTDGSGNILADKQNGDEILWVNGIKENGGSAIAISTTAASLTLAGVPTGIVTRAILNAGYTSATDTASAFISSLDEADQTIGVGNALGNITNMQNVSENSTAGIEVRTNTSAQVRQKAGAAGSLYVFTRGYIDNRGRLS